jgi:hypothetical protein
MNRTLLAGLLGGALGLLVLGAPAFADHAGCRSDVCVTRDDRAQWVMVFSLNECGQLVLESRGRSANYVAAGSIHPDGLCLADLDRGRTGYRIVVTSDRPFCVPPGFARRQAFRTPAHWSAGHSRRLCRLLGVRPGIVRVTAYAGEPAWPHHRHADDGVPCVHRGWPWTGVEHSDRVFVDGVFAGHGFAALVRIAAGGHRVTVVSAQGRKVTRWVSFPASSCGTACRIELACR